MSLWVCSKWNENPTDEEKIEVEEREGLYESVKPVGTNKLWLYLPKDHCRPCDPPKPPERWIDVTAECTVISDTCFITHKGPHDIVHGNRIYFENGYRLRKKLLWEQVGGTAREQWAFVVERKVTV